MSISEELHVHEKILKEITPSRWAFFGLYLIGILFIIFFGLGLIIILFTELRRRGTKYYLTDKRIIYEYKFLKRITSSALYEKVQDVHFTQGIIERIIGIGTIYINTAGSSYIEITLRGIPNPFPIKRLIEAQMMKKHRDVHARKYEL